MDGHGPYSVLMRLLLGAATLLLAACASTPPQAPPQDDQAPSPPAPPAEPAPPDPGPSATCTPRVEGRPSPALADALLAVAPQCFHAAHRGGFDAYQGPGQVFPWFEPTDLEHPIAPPAGARIAASTPSTFLVVSPQGELGVLRRGEAHVAWLGERLYPESAIERSTGEVLATCRSGSGLRLARVGRDGRLDVRDLGIVEIGRRADLGLTADDRPALVFSERDGGRLRLMVSWTLDRAGAVEVDSVELPVPVAELSERTGADLTIAADGASDLAVGWRVLADASFTNVGTASEPPGAPAGAEVRWRTISPDGALGDVHRASTVAQPLAGVSGIGPWGLAPCGLKASTLGGRAIFAWVDGDSIRAARADQDAAVDVAPSEGAPLIAFRGTDRARELLLFDSSPRVRAFALRCGRRGSP